MSINPHFHEEEEEENSDYYITPWKLRTQGQFVDAQLTTDDGQKIDIHRFIVAAASPYFNALFTWNDASVYRVREVSGYNLDKIIMEMYGEEHSFRDIDDAISLLITADRFIVKKMVWRATKFILHNLDTTNCINSWKTLRGLQYKQLKDAAWKAILRDIQHIAQETHQFHNLSAEEVLHILSQDELNVENEDQVKTLISMWIQHKPERINRKQLLERVIRNSSVKPRTPHSVVLCVAGWTGNEPYKGSLIFNPKTSKWTEAHLGSLSFTPLVYYCAQYFQGNLFFAGGYDGSQDSKRGSRDVQCYNIKHRSLTNKKSMLERRCYAASVLLNGFIYVISGFDQREERRTRSVERYDVENDTWESVADTILIRSDAAAVAFFDQIYVMGGFNGEFVHSSVERYNTSTDRWEYDAPMKTQRSGISATVFNRRIYVAGGFDGKNVQNTVEFFDPFLMTWTLLREKLNIARSNMAFFNINNRLFVVGGFDGKQTTKECEEYNQEERAWKIVKAASFPVGISGVKPFIIEDIEGVKLLIDDDEMNPRTQTPLESRPTSGGDVPSFRQVMTIKDKNLISARLRVNQ